MDFTEADWKRLRTLASLGWERACTRALLEVRALVEAQERTSSERFREALELLKTRQRALERALGDMRRSRAGHCLLGLLELDLVEPGELEAFSAPVRTGVALFRATLSGQFRS